MDDPPPTPVDSPPAGVSTPKTAPPGSHLSKSGRIVKDLTPEQKAKKRETFKKAQMARIASMDARRKAKGESPRTLPLQRSDPAPAARHRVEAPADTKPPEPVVTSRSSFQTMFGFGSTSKRSRDPSAAARKSFLKGFGL